MTNAHDTCIMVYFSFLFNDFINAAIIANALMQKGYTRWQALKMTNLSNYFSLQVLFQILTYLNSIHYDNDF